MSSIIRLICFFLIIDFIFCDFNYTFFHCCTLGEKKAHNPLKCDAKIPIPIHGIAVEQQSVCLSTINICCFQLLRKISCRAGAQAARKNHSCDVLRKVDEEIDYKYCCEACKLGMISGSSSTCEVKTVSFGSFWDEAYMSCCKESSAKASVLSPSTNLCESRPGELCSHICIPTNISYECQCRPGYILLADGKSCYPDSVNRCEKSNPCEHNCFDNGISIVCSCSKGFALLSDGKSCEDIDECKEGLHDCDLNSHVCVNIVSSFRCTPTITTMSSPTTTMFTRPIQIPGYVFDRETNNYTDINECQSNPCNSNEVCQNTIGSFTCICAVGYQRDRITGACIDINECQLNSHNCDSSTQRCDNTIGSYHCVRPTGCGTGYTFNSQSLICEDDNECALGTDNCKFLGPGWECRNTMGSFRCEENRCQNPLTCSQTTYPECPKGYQLNKAGICVDINECSSGFSCPVGHYCMNTMGSYRCVHSPRTCNYGLRLNETSNSCTDINECKEQSGVCEHECFNTYGSFKCNCRSGFQLHKDNRSCVDVNECETFKKVRLCAGTCVNQLGSYHCLCPDGYKVGLDGASCDDIDECETEQICNDRNEICLNTRGSYRCESVVCPQNYMKEPDRKNRCRRAPYFCIYNDADCSKTPLSYSYSFITFVSNIEIPASGQLELFNVKGPASRNSSVVFSLELKSANAPSGVPKVSVNNFYLNHVSWNAVTVSLVKSIVGPQDIELELQMHVTVNGIFVGFNVSKLFVFVSRYDF